MALASRTRARLRKMQQAWMRYRRAACEFEAAPSSTALRRSRTTSAWREWPARARRSSRKQPDARKAKW